MPLNQEMGINEERNLELRDRLKDAMMNDVKMSNVLKILKDFSDSKSEAAFVGYMYGCILTHMELEGVPGMDTVVDKLKKVLKKEVGGNG
ncbi:MAG: hypothetical protein PF495_09015 [Spirochaetales bacterium]|jgi:hypothetical protein|nr:hypothetical protein [Spirochaetales bacterium]